MESKKIFMNQKTGYSIEGIEILKRIYSNSNYESFNRTAQLSTTMYVFGEKTYKNSELLSIINLIVQDYTSNDAESKYVRSTTSQDKKKSNDESYCRCFNNVSRGHWELTEQGVQIAKDTIKKLGVDIYSKEH